MLWIGIILSLFGLIASIKEIIGKPDSWIKKIVWTILIFFLGTGMVAYTLYQDKVARESGKETIQTVTDEGKKNRGNSDSNANKILNKLDSPKTAPQPIQDSYLVITPDELASINPVTGTDTIKLTIGYSPDGPGELTNLKDYMTRLKRWKGELIVVPMKEDNFFYKGYTMKFPFGFSGYYNLVDRWNTIDTSFIYMKVTYSNSKGTQKPVEGFYYFTIPQKQQLYLMSENMQSQVITALKKFGRWN